MHLLFNFCQVCEPFRTSLAIFALERAVVNAILAIEGIYRFYLHREVLLRLALGDIHSPSRLGVTLLKPILLEPVQDPIRLW